MVGSSVKAEEGAGKTEKEGGGELVTNFKDNAGRKRARPGAVTARQDWPLDNRRSTWGYMAQKECRIP